MAIFTILILPNHEHWMFLHLFVSSFILLSSGLWLSLNRSFMFLVSCISSYCILLVAIVNGSSFSMWLSLSLLLVYRNACDFWTLILNPETLLKLLTSLRRFLAETVGLLKIQWCRLQTETIWLPPFVTEYLSFLFLAWLPSQNFQYYVEKEWWEKAPLSSASFQRECFQVLPIQYNIDYGFVLNSFYYFEICFIDT